MEKKAVEFLLLVYVLSAMLCAGCAGNGGDTTTTSTVGNSAGSVQASSTLNTSTSVKTTTTSTVARTTTSFAPGCKDSDGRNIYLKGNVSGYSAYAPYDYADECVNENTVLEYYCFSDGVILMEASEEIPCPGSVKCAEGACIRETGPVPVYSLSGGEYVAGVSDKGFTASYGRYKFRIDGFLYHQDSINGITLDVMRPDGTLVSVQASETMPGILASDSLEIFFPGDADDYGGEKTASIYVRDAVENPPNSNATLLLGVSGKGFSTSYSGYKFRIDRFIHGKDSDIMGVKLDVQRPDGAVLSPEISVDGYMKVDKILISFPSRHFLENADEKRADLYVWNSTGSASEKVDLSGIGVAVMNWDKFLPQSQSVRYTETGKYETTLNNAFGAGVYIESVSAREEKSGEDCELVRVNSLPVDKGNALAVKAGDSFKITAQCPKKASDERYQVHLAIVYSTLVGGVKTGFTEAGDIKGTAEL